MTTIKKRLVAYRKSISVVTFAIAVILLVLMLPWPKLITGWQNVFVLGLPVEYFVSLLAAPIIGLFILSVHKDMAEDIDRHTLEYENE